MDVVLSSVRQERIVISSGRENLPCEILRIEEESHHECAEYWTEAVRESLLEPNGVAELYLEFGEWPCPFDVIIL